MGPACFFSLVCQYSVKQQGCDGGGVGDTIPLRQKSNPVAREAGWVLHWETFQASELSSMKGRGGHQEQGQILPVISCGHLGGLPLCRQRPCGGGCCAPQERPHFKGDIDGTPPDAADPSLLILEE